MFSFIKIGKQKLTEEEKTAYALPKHKIVQFDSLPLERVERELSTDIRAVLSYSPANYYKNKDSFLQCSFYFSEDYSSVYMQLENYVNDSPKGKTKIFAIDKILFRDILRKFGQQINIE